MSLLREAEGNRLFSSSTLFDATPEVNLGKLYVDFTAQQFVFTMLIALKLNKTDYNTEFKGPNGPLGPKGPLF